MVNIEVKAVLCYNTAMLIDHVVLKLAAGKGGDGVVRWRREKGTPFGGPAGGDGGRGGSLYLRVVRDITALRDYMHDKEFTAPEGEAGQKRSMHGADGDDLFLRVPLGSIVYNKEYDITYECLVDGEEIKVLKGGKGGLGNEKFKSAVNRTPEQFTKGEIGEFGTFNIELKLIADAGLIGLPNAGKSSLLNALTRAGAKVADYAFTTLNPNLGAYHNFVLADIPGLIEGASEGKGLGHKFLKHITRTKMLVHLVSAENEDVVKEYKLIRKELGVYDKALLSLKEIVVLSKVDMVSDEERKDKIQALEKVSGKSVIELSLLDDVLVKKCGDILIKELA